MSANEKAGSITLSDQQAGPSDQAQEQKQPNDHAFRLLGDAKNLREYIKNKMTKDERKLYSLYGKGLRSKEACEASARHKRIVVRHRVITRGYYYTAKDFEKMWKCYKKSSTKQRRKHDPEAEISDYEA